MAVDKANPGAPDSGKSVSLWEIDQLLLGEIKGEEAAALRRKIAASPELQSYLERSQDQVPRRSFADFQRFRKERQENTPAVTAPAVTAPAVTAPAVTAPAVTGRPTVPITPSKTPSLNWRDWAARIFSGRPRLAYGMAIALLMGMSLWQFRTGQVAARLEAPEAYSPKGGEGMEILLKIAGRELEPGESAEADEGDTVAFTYRSPSAIHVQIWYREDAGNLLPFAAEGPASEPWSSAMRWNPAPQKILLEGHWSRQEIWVVGSRRPLSPAEAKAVIEGGKGAPAGSTAWLFRLKQKASRSAPSSPAAPGAGS